MGSEAAQTTILNIDESKLKSVPNYTYEDSPYPEIHGFPVLVNNTFQKYEQSNQRIDAFRLRLDTEWYGLSGLAARWTSKALEMGATDLTFRLNNSSFPKIFIPFDEVFGAENVVRLCLDTLEVYQKRLKVIKCSGLISLTLTDVRIPIDSFYDILSSCPLIENLSLSEIYDCKNSGDDNGGEEAQKPTISLHKLTSLVLSRVHVYQIQNLFMGDSSSKFPNLKELTLCLSFLSHKGVEKEMCFISIQSLEILNFRADDCQYYDSKQSKRRRVDYSVEFDVPSIRKFTLEGEYIPNVSFRSTSRDQWEESHVRLTRDGELSALWFCQLSRFLTNLTRSKIHLCLHLHCKKSFDYQAGEMEGLDLRELENMTLDTDGLPSLSFNALLDGLFRICRPKMITQHASPPNSNDIFLCRELIGQGMKMKRLLIISQFMLSLLDLEEVNAQKLFDEEWIPQPLDSILDDSQSRFRFQLKWKPW